MLLEVEVAQLVTKLQSGRTNDQRPLKNAQTDAGAQPIPYSASSGVILSEGSFGRGVHLTSI